MLKIQSMIYLITGITIVEDLKKKKSDIFRNNRNGFIKGFCFQRCYWGPHIPWQTSASQSRHQRYFPLATASVTCPLEKQNQKCFNIHYDAGNQSILWPWMNKHCVINAFIQKWEMFCFIWFIEPTRLSSSLSPMYSQGKPELHNVSFLCKLWNGDIGSLGWDWGPVTNNKMRKTRISKEPTSCLNYQNTPKFQRKWS